MLPVLAILAASFALAQVLDVPLERFGPAPEWCAYEKADQYDFTRHPSTGSGSLREDNISTFTAAGGKRTMIWTRDFAPPLDIKGLRHVTFRYRLQGTDPRLYSYTVYFADKNAGGMFARNLIFGAENLLHDGQWHTARTSLKDFDTLQTVALRLRALEGQQGRLDVAWLKLSAAPLKSTLSETIAVQPGHQGRGKPVTMTGTTLLPAVQKALDLEDWFPQEQVTVQGLNFSVPVSGAVAVSTPGEPRTPVALPFAAAGHTLYLLVGADFPPQMLSYGGWEPGDMTDRPEQFHVTVKYADGAIQEHVPYCLPQGRHGMWRGMNAYALPLRAGQQTQELQLHDGMRTSAFHLVAVSVDDAALPALAEPVLSRTPSTRTVVRTVGQELTPSAAVLNTQRGVIRLDLSSGIKLSQASPASLQTQPAPLFSVSEDTNTWASDTFRITERKLGKFGPVELTCVHDEAQVEAKLEIDSREEVWMRLSVRNLSDKPRTLNVIFPEVQLTAANPDDLSYFIPYQCAILSNRDGSHEYAYSGYLPLQFQDCYNRRAGGGLYVATRDLDLRQRYFQLIKGGNKLTQRIEYRWNPPLGPGETVTYPATVIGLHDGDWRASWAAYQVWSRRWYKPVQPRLAWYRDVWNFRTWWTHTMAVSKDRYLQANLYDPDQQAFQTDTFVARDREQFGDIDMIHFFDWRISEKYVRFGNFSHYEDIGGLDKFRAMIKDLQSRGIRVGLYLDAYLCSRKSLIGQAHGEEWAIHDQAGKVRTAYSSSDDPMLNMCVNHPGWQDYLAQTCGRVARETGCDGIYIDEAMSDYFGYWCWRKDHGHPVPGVNQPGLLELCKKTRAALSPNVALYAEWVPADCFMPYMDGAYQAGLRKADPLYSPGFLQTMRFAYPDFRVLTISNGGSMYDAIWEGVKYNLFSGVPLYSLAWGHDDECLPIFRRYSAILHEYGPEFNTMAPRPFVDTEAAEVHANEFPGSKRTVWTLFNGRFDTFAGPVLKVKHTPGATYRDVWNQKALQPRIVGGFAVLETSLGPRGIGVIAQIRK
jgi:hypothetical protein